MRSVTRLGICQTFSGVTAKDQNPRMQTFETLTYETRDRKAYITLNRPERLNAINGAMPGEIRRRGRRANDDPDVHVIVLQGAGRAFCAGYDLKLYAEEGDRHPGAGLGPDQGLPLDEAQHRRLHQPVPIAQADDLPRCRATPSPAAATSRCAATWS